MHRVRGPGRDRRPPPDRKRSPPPPRDRRRRSPPPRLRDRSPPPRKREAFSRPPADVQVVILANRRYGDQCAEAIRAAGFWVETRYLEGQRLRDVIGQAEKEASSYLVIVGIDNEQDKNVSFKILDSNQPPISRVSIKTAIDLIMEHDRRRRRPLRYIGEPPPVVTHRAFSPDRRLPSPDRRPLHRLSPPPHRLRSRSPPFRSSPYGQPPPHYPQDRLPDRLPIDRDRLPMDRDRAPIERDGYQRPPLHMIDDRMFMRRSSRELSPPVRGKKVYEPAYGQAYDRPPYYDHGYDARSGPAARDYMQMPPSLDPGGYPRTGQYGPMGVAQRSPPRHPSAAQAAGIDDAAVSDLLETLEDIEKSIGNGHPASVGRPHPASYPSDAYDMRGQAPPYRR